MLLSLALGVLWMVGAIGAFHWRINFLNFIALPITFGIGVDYSVNIFGRLHRDRREGQEVDVVKVLRETGGAVMLCSYHYDRLRFAAASRQPGLRELR